MYIYLDVFDITDVFNVCSFLSTDEREQMCNFYKERGMEVPKPGKTIALKVSVNRLNTETHFVLSDWDQWWKTFDHFFSLFFLEEKISNLGQKDFEI